MWLLSQCSRESLAIPEVCNFVKKKLYRITCRVFNICQQMKIVVAFLAVFASSDYYGHGFLYAILEFAMLTACLQIGYASGLLSSSIPGTWRRLRNPRESSRPVAPMAATRHR